jgi:adenosine kinase
MKYDVLTSGYVSLDRIIRVKTPLKTGFTSLIENKDNAKINYGGCPVNIAYLLSRLGVNALPLIRVGGDYRETGLYGFLMEGGICADAIKVIPDEATSNCYLIADSENNHITVFYPGAMDEKYSTPMSDELFKNTGMGVLTVGPHKDNIEFFLKCKKYGVPLVFGMKCDFEAFPEDFFSEVLLESRIIFSNEAERGEIESMMGLDSITDLFERGKTETIVTTLGKKGSSYYHKAGSEIETGHIPAAEFGEVVDTTGSGDAFMAGFIYGYLKKKSIEECCGMGSVLASFIIEKVGCLTNAPSKTEFIMRYEQFILSRGRFL